MEAAIGGRGKVNIFGNDYSTKDGTGIRDYVHVMDLAIAHLDAIDFIEREDKNLILNLGTGTGHSVLDVISKVQEISNKSIDYVFKDRRDGDSDIVMANSKLAKKLMSWEARYSDLDTIIKSTWSVYK